ncbi:hypothetical protein DL764_000593 [Monosporascus ibericus]|uniref:Phosphoglycerate mutase family protein n=1 Tax=Monosporascus ibericus TaxID=155417 RepID=A0A4Q4TY26_9PEZI|nr:hypothetical protein DL764_000593 [Monosporascus ibericus]
MKKIALLALASLALAKPTIYLIRHGEKPKDGNGLNKEGEQRAQCLRTVFGAGSEYNITHIMAQTPKSNGKRKRPYDTVKPLADDLGLTVDISCDRDDSKCVADLVNGYTADGNILICWKHGEMKTVAKRLGAKGVKDYPDDRFDLIWTLPYDYKEIVSIESENCPGLDN